MLNPLIIIGKIKRKLSKAPFFATDDVKIGRNVSFGKNIVFNCKKVRIGDGVIFQNNITVNADCFEIGDYGTIYDSCFFPGPGKLQIGHNFWLGTACIVDSQGETVIGNNVGIGANSQIWTHMIFGDVMYGCRFHSVKRLEIEDDVWLVGHCLVSPVSIGARSLAMLGSVITKEMKPDHTYGGVPAIDITEKVGPQFKVTSIEEKKHYLKQRIELFARHNKITDIYSFVKIVACRDETLYGNKNVTIFNVADRTYLKTGFNLEYKLIRFLLPEAKFIPTS